MTPTVVEIDYKKKLQRAEKAIREGRLPVINSYIPGMNELIRSYGLEKDVFLPKEGMTRRAIIIERSRFNESKRYRLYKKGIGEKVNIIESAKLQEAKVKLLKILKNA